MIDPAVSEKLIGGGVVVLTILADWFSKRWEKSHPVKKADEAAAAAIDIGKVLLDHDKAHLEELDNVAAEHKAALEQYEVRELNLTAQNAELIRQAATRDAFYQSEMRRVQEASRAAHEEAGAARFDLELCIGREHDLQSAAITQTRQHEGEQLLLRRQNMQLRAELEDYVRRYGKKGGEFSATDVLRGRLDE